MSQDNSKSLISMIVSTLGRDVELTRLLESLAKQDDGHFELIIVDQNNDDRLTPIVTPFVEKFPITHLKTDLRGVDRGRNFGVNHAAGEWLFFPDDDSWYDADFLATLRGIMARENADIYSGRALNSNGDEIMVPFLQEDADISRANVWQVLIEWMILFRAETFRKSGGFDEDIGVGAGTIWGSGECQDLVLRCLKAGAKGVYRRAIVGYHPDQTLNLASPAEIQKMYAYSVGYGFIMRRHGYAWSDIAPSILRPLAGIVLHTLRGKTALAKRSRRILEGRLRGWLSWNGQAATCELLQRR